MIAKYRVTTYQKLNDVFDFVELGDYSYGEWIIYEEDTPRFHVNIFRKNSESDKRVKELIDYENKSIESIIAGINLSLDLKLDLGKRPLIETVLESTIKELELNPIPIQW